LRRRFLNDPPHFSIFVIISPLKMTVSSLVEIGPVVLEKKIFKKFPVYFYSFAIISPWRRVIPFI
jgi:hypothetical protein